ncbi:uncharacterized protein [Asterias amurensis]|uniref:uncharacterized protein n=1 Tax=Asterias amurensis TaxID=7602 RepID=UPI003AB537EB
MEIRCLVAFVVCIVEVASQNVIELTVARLTDGDVFFGGTLELSTPNGWERVCYGNFNIRMADTVCRTLGFPEGAMSVRTAASQGLNVNPLPSLGCQNSVVAGDESLQCVYLNTCDDHVVVTCNYPGYLGCYSHSRSNPSLDDGMFTNSNMTIQTCLTICRHRGYPYAGLAFGQECYCEAHEVDVSKKLENEECYLPCVGNRQQICGGGTAAGIYDSRLGSCNTVYNDVEGAIATPGFPGKYVRDEQCTWTIDVPSAVNITVEMQSIELYDKDQLKMATTSQGISEYVIFTGSPSSSNIHFETSGPVLSAGSQLVFTFTGGRISVTFNSTVTSAGAQGVVLIYSAAIGEFNPPPQMNTTEQPQTTRTSLSLTTQPNTTSQQPPTNATNAPTTITPVTPTTPTRGSLTTSAAEFTTSLETEIPTEQSPTSSDTSTSDKDVGVTMTVDSTVTVGGVWSTTPRSISMASTQPKEAPLSIAVIIAIGVGVVLVLMLILTFVVLFTSCGGDTKRPKRRQPHGMLATNAAYSSTHGQTNDMQFDSGIYDPGYDNANEVDTEPIYLSIRNDPRAEQLRRMDEAAAKRENNRSYESVNNPPSSVTVNREDSVKTTKTDHDYQSVHGVSRKNTEKSYISIYPDREGSIFNSGRVPPPVRLPSDSSHDVTEDGYMIPTPKNSTQIQITKL